MEIDANGLGLRHVELAGFVPDGSVFVITGRLNHASTQLVNQLAVFDVLVDIAPHSGRFAVGNQRSCSLEDTETCGAPAQESAKLTMGLGGQGSQKTYRILFFALLFIKEWCSNSFIVSKETPQIHTYFPVNELKNLVASHLPSRRRKV